MQEAETPQGETQATEALGTEQQPATGSEGTPEGSESKTDVQPVDSVDSETKTNIEPSQSDAELERLRKEADKKQMEINMLKNKQREEELKRLEESEDHKELAERYKAELDRIEMERAQKEADEEAQRFKNEVIDAYPDEKTREAARKLLAQNDAAFHWGTAESYEQARQELNKQLDTFKSLVSPEPAQPEVGANNPAPVTPAPQDRSQALREAHDKRDFGSLLAEIPSVKQQLQEPVVQ